MHGKAGHGARVTEPGGKRWAGEFGIADLDGERDCRRRPAAEDRHEGGDPGRDPWHVGHEPPAERRKLKHERPRLRAEPRECRSEERGRCGRGVEKRGIIAGRLAAARLAEHRIGERRRRLDDEPKPLGHVTGVGRKLVVGEGRVERAVEAHGAEERMRGVGGKPVAGELLLGGRLAIPQRKHEARPARKRPARGAQVDGRRQPLAEPPDGVVHDSRVDRLGVGKQQALWVLGHAFEEWRQLESLPGATVFHRIASLFPVSVGRAMP